MSDVINPKDYKNWCEFMRVVEKDPSCQIKGWTVGEFLKFKEHVHGCEDCMKIADQMNVKNPPTLSIFSTN